MGAEHPLTSTERSRQRRAALRARGLRPRTAWLPDSSSPEVQDEVRRALNTWWALATDEDQVQAFAQVMADDVLADLPPPWTDD